jgi:hypothetical protein
MSEPKLIQRSAAVLSRSVGDETILVRPGREDIDVLSATASLVWTMLEEPSTVLSITEFLAGIYPAERPRIEQDVHRLVAEMEERGWVTRVEDD